LVGEQRAGRRHGRRPVVRRGSPLFNVPRTATGRIARITAFGRGAGQLMIHGEEVQTVGGRCTILPVPLS
jgi:hypothetical protein